MTTQTFNLRIPQQVFQRLQRTAEREQRSVGELMIESIVAANPESEDVPSPQVLALAQMVHLNDAALWQAARATLRPSERERLQALHDLEDERTLLPAERDEEQALLELFHQTLLVRAQAVRLLQQRGYDISDAAQFAPLE